MNLYCSYTKRTVEESYGKDGDYSGYNHYAMENHCFYLSKSSNSDFLLQSNIDESNAKYVLAVIYSSGGTFGRTDGYVELIEISNDLEKLEKIAEKIKNNTYGYDPECKKCNSKSSYCKEHSLHKPWVGYFSTLEDVIIEELEVKKIRKSYLNNEY